MAAILLNSTPVITCDHIIFVHSLLVIILQSVSLNHKRRLLLLLGLVTINLILIVNF